MSSSISSVHRVSHQERTISEHALSRRPIEQPFFAFYHDIFVHITGTNPSIELALEKDYPFAHEAGVYFPDQDVVFITSNRFKPEGSSTQTIWVSKLTRQKDGTWNCEKVETDVAMGNGGINYQSGVLFCDQGNKDQSGGLVLMEAKPPYATKTLIDGFHGRLFNSVNDVVLHTDGSIWFTDPIYGYEQGFRNSPQLPCQVYCFDPVAGHIRVVADGFGRPNGLCFSTDQKTMYITDTDFIHGDGCFIYHTCTNKRLTFDIGTTDLMRPSTIYAFDVIDRHGANFLANRRVFAMADNVVPDGIKCDLNGNVFSGCGDGINVWNPRGLLIGKIVIPGGIANFCFARKGELILLNETRVWVAKISDGVQGALLANMGIAVE